MEPFAPFGLLFVFALLWVPTVNGAFFDVIDSLLGALGIHEVDTYCGYDLFRFWREANEYCSVSP